MKELLVSIERGGERIPVGFIRGEGSADARFAYSDTWLRDPSSAPISLSLPLQEAPFTPAQTKAYFDGLLPEGFTRSTVAQWMHVDDGDYLSILHGLGRECLGALCITEEGEDPQASYEKITREQVRELAAEGASKSAEIVTSTHLSLTGASGKVGLYFDAPMKTVKEMLTSSNREASAVLSCGMESEQICRRIEEIPDDAGYFSLIISRQHGGRS